jgi:hypothetical protein
MIIPSSTYSSAAAAARFLLSSPDMQQIPYFPAPRRLRGAAHDDEIPDPRNDCARFRGHSLEEQK